jgi:hypothetical protein
MCINNIMPIRESQKKAMHNYRMRNKDRLNEMLYKWREENDDTYKEKQREYCKQYRSKQRVKTAFLELCAIDL